jgi:hypothetical protein
MPVELDHALQHSESMPIPRHIGEPAIDKPGFSRSLSAASAASSMGVSDDDGSDNTWVLKDYTVPMDQEHQRPLRKLGIPVQRTSRSVSPTHDEAERRSQTNHELKHSESMTCVWGGSNGSDPVHHPNGQNSSRDDSNLPLGTGSENRSASHQPPLQKRTSDPAVSSSGAGASGCLIATEITVPVKNGDSKSDRGGAGKKLRTSTLKKLGFSRRGESRSLSPVSVRRHLGVSEGV